MKTLLIYLSIFLLFASCKKDSGDKNNCNHDYIIAGDSLSNCSEIIKIDTVFDEYHHYELDYKIDVNDDDNFDLKFVSFRNVATHGTSVETGCYLVSENPLLELSVKEDSLFYTYINLKNLMDTIGENDEWLNNERKIIYISFLDYILHEDPLGGGNNWISYSDSTNRNIRQKYIGIRINETSFTNYYWIKFSIEEYTKVHIEELGRQIR